MKDKRGQVTIFIIVAVLVVAGAGVYFFVKGGISRGNTPVSGTEEVYNFVEDCTQKVGEAAVYYIGQHGGHYLPPERYTENGVPIYFLNGEIFIPSKENIEGNISGYFDDALNLCLDDFSSFNNFNITSGKIKVSTKIYDDYVSLSLNYPLVIKKGEDTYRIEDFGEARIPVRLGIIHSMSESIVQQHYQNPLEICISCLSDLQNENGMLIEMRNFDNLIIYNLVDPKSKLNSNGLTNEPEPYSFSFAVGY